jgi:ferredoxin-NADP reductase
LRVSRIEKESATVKSFSLMPADDRPLVAALPGQFIILRIKPNADGPPVLRNYSLSDLPSDDHYRVSVKLEENGAASTYLHTHVGVGDVLGVAAPRGAFTLGPDGKKVVLISAGVGVTPVLAMLHALAAEASPREIWWLYGARNRDDHPFAEEALNLIKSLPSAKSYVEYSRPGLEDRVGLDFDAAGRIGTEVLQKIGVPHDADFYLCGPAAFMDDLTAGLKAWGVADDRVHGEIFGPSKAITPGIADAPHAPPHAPVGPAGIGPQISFARSGLNARWDPKFGSLLDFAEACEVPVRWSCRTGVCHMCESGLISGNVKYQPDPLDPPAQGNLLLCCAQPAGDIVLDL